MNINLYEREKERELEIFLNIRWGDDKNAYSCSIPSAITDKPNVALAVSA